MFAVYAVKAFQRPLAKASPILLSPILDEKAQQNALRDSTWADGLRGVAAVMVVASHLVLCFARQLVFPCCNEFGHPRFFQRPILRLPAQGPAWVALFFILSGFVNALKPLKLARGGNTEAALSGLALNSVRRTFRLVLPAAAATFISWTMCQAGAYDIARRSDAYWINMTSPAPSPSWTDAVEDFFRGLKATWSFLSENPYDQPQWALVYLLQGSIMIIGALLATVSLSPRYRIVTLMALYLCSFDWTYKFGDPLVGMNVFGGVILAELSLSSWPAKLSRYSLLISPVLATVALTLMSYPMDAPHNAPWSNALLKFGERYLPLTHELGRLWPSLGAQLLAFSVILSPHLRCLLSQPILLWLGKVSFPIYLLHGTFMRTLFAWVLFHNQDLTMVLENVDGQTYRMEKYLLPGPLWTALSVAVLFAAMLPAAHVWSVKIEPWFGWMTKKAEEHMFENDGSRVILPVKKP